VQKNHAVKPFLLTGTAILPPKTLATDGVILSGSTTERRISKFLCLAYCNYLVFCISTLFFKAVCIFLYIHRSTTIFYNDTDISTTPFPSQKAVFTRKTTIVAAKLTVSTWKLSNKTSLHVKARQLQKISRHAGSNCFTVLHVVKTVFKPSFPTFLKVMCLEQIALKLLISPWLL